MKTDFNFENAKVGDEVYHAVWGWTNISVKEKKYFEVFNCAEPFLMNGKRNLINVNPTIYPYNPFKQNQERVVEVFTTYGKWVKRVLIAEKDGKAVCWVLAETLEEAKNKSEAQTWSEWREIQPKKELTFKEKVNLLWEKHEKELWKQK